MTQKKLAPALGPAVMGATDHELRAIYADIIAEGAPERFIAILRRLDEPRDEGSTFRASDRKGRRRPMSEYTVSFGG